MVLIVGAGNDGHLSLGLQVLIDDRIDLPCCRRMLYEMLQDPQAPWKQVMAEFLILEPER